jgi:hypothetical protein
MAIKKQEAALIANVYDESPAPKTYGVMIFQTALTSILWNKRKFGISLVKPMYQQAETS